MAGVFGNLISDETLNRLPLYDGKTIGAIDRARVALGWMNAEGKDVRALEYAENLKQKLGAEVFTLCIVYNATGGTLQYAGHKDWSGYLGSASYPMLIENGQWGAFIHRNPADSIGAVVYRGTNAQNNECDWMLSWKLHKSTYDNRVYTEVRETNHFNGNGIWDQVNKSLWSSSDFVHKSESNGCLSFVSIGNAMSSVFTGILTLENAI